jgi:1-deoxy-D-xylulose-5-phosphate synthase
MKKNTPKELAASQLKALIAPQDVLGMSTDQLVSLAGELRAMIIDTVSHNGGHLAPSLGVVDLTVALLKVFDPGRDRIVWDVGHQSYAYKILTSRRDRFATLRKKGGISGFPRRHESPYDHFGVGHSSTSISAALGMAQARDLRHQDHRVVAVIGDGSMTAGLAYEGLNQAGDLGSDLIVVLNDNEMSISKNVGALSSFLSRQLSNRWMIRLKREMESWMRQIPKIGEELANYAKRSEESFKSFFTPGMLYEAFNFNYLGPIDGHSIRDLVSVFEQVRSLQGPVLVHVLTTKGKGYGPAETNPTYFHGVGCFEPETGLAVKPACGTLPTYTEVFGRTLCALAERDPAILAITAAMPEGTGLVEFGKRFPRRFYDVGICEQHAVTFAAGLATQGFKPVVAIYSTFMQRSYDQVVHDVCLQNLNVTFCLDRAGLVGEDGATHHGAFDVAYMRHIPNMVVMAPKDEAELQDMLGLAVAHEGPTAIRYPRGVGVGVPLEGHPREMELGKGELLKEGGDALVIALGSRVHPALEVAIELEAEGVSVAVFNARFVKPLPSEQILGLVGSHRKVLVLEEGVVHGGFGSAVLEMLAASDSLSGLTVRLAGIPDQFVEHGSQKELRVMLRLDKTGIAARIRELVAGS